MEKIKLLLYCTKSKPYLMNLNNEYFVSNVLKSIAFNGQIVAECDFEVEEIRIVDDEIWNWWYETKTLSKKELCKKSCLSEDEIYDYLGEDNEGYAIHIKNLNIFDKPRELTEYGTETSPIFMKPLENAPQNMMSCIDAYDNQYILISIRAEWICKILNGEKTIEVRKKVLKEMINNA